MSNINTDISGLFVKAITAFRLGREAEGSDALINIMDCISPVLNSNEKCLGADDALLINELLDAQSREDYLFVADLLEYIFPTTALGKLCKNIDCSH